MAGPSAIDHPPEFDEAHDYGLIELLFFAYRDFVGDADQMLDRYGFGRAHHRVLHFVNRRPGLTVADLLDILKITKQSLGPVLRELVDGGYLVQKASHLDRRKRLLFPTPQGRDLSSHLTKMQSRRIREALAAAKPGMRPQIERFLMAMIEPEERDIVQQKTLPMTALDAEAALRSE